MKVYKDDRGSHDLEVQIERLQIRVRELEDINEAHKKLNGEFVRKLQILMAHRLRRLNKGIL